MKRKQNKECITVGGGGDGDGGGGGGGGRPEPKLKAVGEACLLTW